MKIAWGAYDFPQLAGIVDHGWGMLSSEDALVFVDNHDNQRGHGGAGLSLSHPFFLQMIKVNDSLCR